MRRVWLESLIAGIVVTGMILCIVLSGVALGRMIVPSWDGTYVVLFCALASFESFISFRLYRQLNFYVTGGGRYRLIEGAALLLLFLTVANLAEGYPLLDRGFPNVRLHALLLFIPVWLCWGTARAVASDLDRVRREEETVRMPVKSSDDTVRDSMPSIAPEMRRLTLRFFAGGVALFVLAGLTQTENAQFLHVTSPDLVGPIFNVLAYFALGMVMLALLHFAMLSIRWAVAGNILAPALVPRWTRYAAIFLAGVAIFAFLLPTSYGTELLGTLRSGLEQVLSSAGTTFAGLMEHLHLKAPPPRALPPGNVKPPHGFHPTGRGAPGKGKPLNIDWLFVLRAVLFWGASLALVGYLLRGYLAAPGRGAAGGRALARRFLAWLDGLWSRLRGRVRRYVGAVRDRRPSERKGAPEAPIARPPSRRFGGRRTPRERVLYYFASIAQRLEKRGVRRPSQTPLELEAAARPAVRDEAAAMHDLTAAYLEARYSSHPVEAEDAQRAEGNWQRVRAALRRGQPRPEDAS